ncbi:hypothetical protein [Photobacterium leiognathi]|uniref:hypothetical protein n=1 Tax=Photobacterium leiognathi TaxID=553611 RepID=UPI00273876BA|nr:hypothetical protein [Photobacterium leiognathi]
MIQQAYKQPGLLANKPNTSIFPMMSDLVLVFFPTPGIFVRDTLTVPASFRALPVNYYNEKSVPFDNMYVFIPAVKLEHYKGTGLAYSENTLHFEPELIEALAQQSPMIIEHSHSLM